MPFPAFNRRGPAIQGPSSLPGGVNKTPTFNYDGTFGGWVSHALLTGDGGQTINGGSTEGNLNLYSNWNLNGQINLDYFLFSYNGAESGAEASVNSGYLISGAGYSSSLDWRIQAVVPGYVSFLNAAGTAHRGIHTNSGIVMSSDFGVRDAVGNVELGSGTDITWSSDANYYGTVDTRLERNTSGGLLVTNTLTTQPQLTIKGTASQTADYFQIQDSSGTARAGYRNTYVPTLYSSVLHGSLGMSIGVLAGIEAAVNHSVICGSPTAQEGFSIGLPGNNATERVGAIKASFTNGFGWTASGLPWQSGSDTQLLRDAAGVVGVYAANESTYGGLTTGTLKVGGSSTSGYFGNSTASFRDATAGDGGTNSGDGAVVSISQLSAWSANQEWALHVSGYTYLNGFRVAGSGQRALYLGTEGGHLDFASNQGIVTFTNGFLGTAERMRINTDGKIGIGIDTAPDGQLHVVCGASTTKGFVVRGAASQTANLLEVQDSSGTFIAGFGTEACKISGANPGFWLDETGSGLKGCYIVLDAGLLQFQRRAQSFGGYEGAPFSFNINSGKMTAATFSADTGVGGVAYAVGSGDAIRGLAATGGNLYIDASQDVTTGSIHLRCDQVVMPYLPTSDPAVAGALWNDSGTLKISAG